MNARSNRFVAGQTYFIVMFQDEILTVPIVQTLSYEEEGTRTNGTKYFLFREHHLGDKSSKFFVNEEDADHLVLDRERLIQKLKNCFDGTLLTSPP